MTTAETLAGMLGIPATAVSKRLCFIKGSFLDTVWHIGDFDTMQQEGERLFLLTLHGAPVPKAVEADSLSSVLLQDLSPSLQLCAECVDEFRASFDAIQKHPQARFVEFRAVYEESQKTDAQIGAGSLLESKLIN